MSDTKDRRTLTPHESRERRGLTCRVYITAAQKEKLRALGKALKKKPHATIEYALDLALIILAQREKDERS